MGLSTCSTQEALQALGGVTLTLDSSSTTFTRHFLSMLGKKHLNQQPKLCSSFTLQMKDFREFALPHCMNGVIHSSHMSFAPSLQASIRHLFCSFPKTRRIADYSEFPSTNCSLRKMLNRYAAEPVEESCRAGRTIKGFGGYAQDLENASRLDRSGLESLRLVWYKRDLVYWF
jgi:hypothetical protein